MEEYTGYNTCPQNPEDPYLVGLHLVWGSIQMSEGCIDLIKPVSTPSAQSAKVARTIAPILAQLEQHLPVNPFLLRTPLDFMQRSHRQRLDNPAFLTNRRSGGTPHHPHSHAAMLNQIQSLPKLNQRNRKEPPRVNPFRTS